MIEEFPFQNHKEKIESDKETKDFEIFIKDKEGKIIKGFIIRGNLKDLREKLEELINKYGPEKSLTEIIDELFNINKESQN